MPDMLPYREGQPRPDGNYVLGRIVDDDGSETLYWVNPQTLKDGSIRHEHLDEILPVIRWTWRHFGKYTGVRSFEAWELGFLRDTHPEEEVAAWVRTAYAFLEFTHRNPTCNKSAVANALIHLLVGRGDVIRPKSVARKLTRLMANPPRELCDLTHFNDDGTLTTGKSHLR